MTTAAAGDVNWPAMGEGVLHPTAREVGRLHGVPLDVVLHMPAGAHDRLASVEDHVVVETDEANHLIKFADYGQFMNVFVIPPPPPPPRDQAYPLGRLTVVVMPYADLASCKQLDELSSRAATPHLRGRYLRIEIANRDLLLRKLRATAKPGRDGAKIRSVKIGKRTKAGYRVTVKDAAKETWKLVVRVRR
jgi:hypothetical protein